MQLIGIGVPELLLILVLTVLVVGPERLPETAAQIARWIRTARAYANAVSKDFTEFATELEKETGASRKDLEEIASVLRRDTTSVLQEIDKAGKEVQEATDLEKATGATVIEWGATGAKGQATNGATDSTAAKEVETNADPSEATAASENGAQAEAAGEQEWFRPSQGRRRRRSGQDVT